MGITDLLGWALFGLIVGSIARFIWPGRKPSGCFTTILLGVAGSVIGGMIAHALTGGPGHYHLAGWIMSILGAIVVLWIYGATMSKGPGD